MGHDTTWVARHAKISGRIEADGDVQVDGRVEGSIRAGSQVSISVGGVAVAEIHAGRAHVRGVVIGNVIASERIDVGSGARVVGDLRAPLVDIDAGATIEGRVERSAPEAEALPSDRATRTTVRLARPGLRRPSRPDLAAIDPPEAAPLPALVERATEGPSTPSPPAPARPRPAGRARLVPRRTPDEGS